MATQYVFHMDGPDLVMPWGERYPVPVPLLEPDRPAAGT